MKKRGRVKHNPNVANKRSRKGALGILEAIKKNSISEVEASVQDEVELGTVDSKGNGILHYAVDEYR